jgi:hypothetical protein
MNNLHPIFRKILSKWIKKPEVKIYRINNESEDILYTVNYLDGEEESRWPTLKDAIKYCKKAGYEICE